MLAIYSTAASIKIPFFSELFRYCFPLLFCFWELKKKLYIYVSLQDSDDESEHPMEQANIQEEIMNSPTESLEPDLSRPGSSQSSASAKRPRYPQTPKYGRSKGKDVKRDELFMLAGETMKKYCSAEVNQTPQASINSLSDVDIAGMKYARDLASLDPVQRSFVEKLVADAIFYARLGKLTENSTLQHHISSFEHAPSYNTNYIQQSANNPQQSVNNPQQSVNNNGFTPIHYGTAFPNTVRNSNEGVERVQSQGDDVISNMSQYLRFNVKP